MSDYYNNNTANGCMDWDDAISEVFGKNNGKK